MNLFQWITLSVLALLLVGEGIGSWRHAGPRGFRLVRCLAWLAAALAIAHPEFVQEVASAIGIGRGADVLLYLTVLAFLGTTFYFYSRYVRLQRQLTEVVRHLAIREARRGAKENGPASA